MKYLYDVTAQYRSWDSSKTEFLVVASTLAKAVEAAHVACRKAGHPHPIIWEVKQGKPVKAIR